MKRFAALVLLALWVFLACGAAEESDKGEPQRLVITAVGDCTLGGDAQKGGSNEKFFQKFVDKYDLKVSDQYADTLKELVDNGKAAQAQNDEKEAVNALVSSLQWSTTDDGYGSYTLTTN